MSPYLLAFIIALAINVFFFLFAYAFRTDKFTDFTYGLTFILLTLYFLVSNQSFLPAQLILSTMVILWGIRLITYLLIRILKIKRDSRFDDRRENWLAFLQFWLFQGIAVFLIMLPSVYVLHQPQTTSINWLMILGILIWMMGLLMETVADWQKFTFKNMPKNKDLWIQSGLWKYSRHPNYFGEMLVWWGIFIYVAPLLRGMAWLTIISPIFITYILMFVSGIPLLEKRYDKKYKDNTQYQVYIQRTRLLVPLPNKDNFS